MPQATYSVTLSAGGVSIQKPVTRSADGAIAVEATIPAAKSGTLTARTDADTGEATMSASHGITTSDVVDVYWSGGKRLGMTVGTVDGNDVPLDGGSGDDLPSTSTALAVQVRQQVNVAIDGDALVILGVSLEYTNQSSTERGSASFQKSDDTEVEAVSLVANTPQVWDIEGGASNGFSGDPIAKAMVTHSDTTNTATLKIVGLQDVTP
jgi:hypothetical protein